MTLSVCLQDMREIAVRKKNSVRAETAISGTVSETFTCSFF